MYYGPAWRAGRKGSGRGDDVSQFGSCLPEMDDPERTEHTGRREEQEEGRGRNRVCVT